MNMKHTTKALLIHLALHAFPQKMDMKGMKHKCFSSLSFHVELTSSQQRMMAKDTTHTTEKYFWGMYFLKIMPCEF